MNATCRLVGATLAVLVGLGTAQAQDAARGARKIFTRNTAFRLPVQLDDRDRADLSGIKFFVRALPGDWVLAETAPPTQTAFGYRAAQDGEYWFAFATVDKSGQQTPPEIDREKPALVVVVDTVPPEPDVHVLPVASGQILLQCKLRDANPDYASVKLEYPAGPGAWKPLEPLPDTPGVFQIPDNSVLDGKVRVTAADRAGNTATKEIDLGAVRGLPRTAAKPESIAPPPAAPVVPPPPAPMPFTPPAAPDVTPERPTALPPPIPPEAAVPPAPAIEPRPIAPVETPAPPVVEPVTPPPAGPGPAAPPIAPPALANTSATTPATAETSVTAPPNGPVILINSLRCRVEYAVEQAAGPVEKVEIWATANGGKSWKLYGEDEDKTSPAEVDLPGDGVFGFCIVVKAGGAASPAPKPGDPPDVLVEIDTTKPVAQLLGATLGTGADAGTASITWTARDKNLGPAPVTLLYAAQPVGPWQPLAKAIPNDGLYRWAVPPGIGAQVFLRLEVADRAGNVARADARGPLVLEASRPRAKVLTVAPGTNPGR